MVIGTLALTGIPFHRRLFLQGRDHRGGVSQAITPSPHIRLGVDRHRGASDELLFLASDLPDVPRQAPCLGRRDASHPRIAERHAHPALHPVAQGRYAPASFFEGVFCIGEGLGRVLAFGAGHRCEDSDDPSKRCTKCSRLRSLIIPTIHDGDRLPRRLAVLHPAAPNCRHTGGGSAILASTSSSSTSGISTSSTSVLFVRSAKRRSAGSFGRPVMARVIDGLRVPTAYRLVVVDVTNRVVKLQIGIPLSLCLRRC